MYNTHLLHIHELYSNLHTLVVLERGALQKLPINVPQTGSCGL